MMHACALGVVCQDGGETMLAMTGNTNAFSQPHGNGKLTFHSQQLKMRSLDNNLFQQTTIGSLQSQNNILLTFDKKSRHLRFRGYSHAQSGSLTTGEKSVLVKHKMQQLRCHQMSKQFINVRYFSLCRLNGDKSRRRWETRNYCLEDLICKY